MSNPQLSARGSQDVQPSSRRADVCGGAWTSHSFAGTGCNVHSALSFAAAELPMVGELGLAHQLMPGQTVRIPQLHRWLRWCLCLCLCARLRTICLSLCCLTYCMTWRWHMRVLHRKMSILGVIYGRCTFNRHLSTCSPGRQRAGLSGLADQ